MSAEVAKVLRGAADLLERDGWCRYAGRDRDGRHCAVGALAEATGMDAPVGALKALSRHLRKFSWEVPAWNDDQPGPEPVIAALRAAADEAGGDAA